MVKCAICGKDVAKEKAIFEKGKFFDGKKCQEAYHKKAKEGGSSKKEVCEFC